MDEHTDISCEDATMLVSDSRDGPLDEQAAASLQFHVQHCPYCSIAYKQFDSLFAQLGQLLHVDKTPS
ncbi:zf-HC2 domain-containing protein [Undibacterium sp. TJN25]|uniref:zf-HC2 domain-containing protein n=1 Tax=Undibacterium sp. TJN25 TaxID=3413056 RepID=UPI003BF380F7